jgi:hypothetical protein
VTLKRPRAGQKSLAFGDDEGVFASLFLLRWLHSVDKLWADDTQAGGWATDVGRMPSPLSAKKFDPLASPDDGERFFSLAIHHNEAARSFQVTLMMLDVATLASQAAFPCVKLPLMSAAKCPGVSLRLNFNICLAFFLLENINCSVKHMYAKL